jgi:hypothetical protein
MEATMNIERLTHTGRWHLERLADRIDWQHTAALGLFALWTALLITIDLPLRAETQRIAARLEHDSTHAPDESRVALLHSATPDLTREFVASLPHFEKCTDQVGALNLIANQSGVVVASAHYRYEQLPGLPVTKVVLAIDARGDEAQQRKFLQTALNALPNLAIARLVYTKHTDGASPVKLKLDLSMYFQSRPKAAT